MSSSHQSQFYCRFVGTVRNHSPFVKLSSFASVDILLHIQFWAWRKAGVCLSGITRQIGLTAVKCGILTQTEQDQSPVTGAGRETSETNWIFTFAGLRCPPCVLFRLNRPFNFTDCRLAVPWPLGSHRRSKSEPVARLWSGARGRLMEFTAGNMAIML